MTPRSSLLTVRTRVAAAAAAALLLGAGLAACADEPATGNRAEQTTPEEGSTMDHDGDTEVELIGVWKSDEKGDPHLKFVDDGRVSGSDGCNGIGGTFTAEGDTAVIELGGSTLMACPGVDDWLRRVASVKFDATSMTVFDTDGTEIGQLQRAD